MEFLVGIDVTIPDGTPESEVKERLSVESIAAAGLARQGHLVRRWKPPVAPGQSKAVGLYRADSYTLQTGGGDVLYVQSRGVRHGSAEVLAQIETAAAESRLAEHGGVRERWRAPAERRGPRDLPRSVS